MHAQQITSCVLAVVLINSIIAAPVKEAKTLEKRDAAAHSPSTKIADQESQLENLVSLAGEKTKENNVAVHESHVSHYENKNGQEVKSEKTEEKVTDTNTGKVLADVKQVTETGSDANGQPKQVTETEVDIPDEGVHKTFINNDSEEEEMVPVEAEGTGPNLDLSPTEVAKYLLDTGDFGSFYAALQDLVASNVMSDKDAERYEEAVIVEYQGMASQQGNMEGALLNEEPMAGYFPAYDKPEMKRSMADQVQEDLYGLDNAYENYPAGDLDLVRQEMMANSPSGEEESLSNIIDALLNAWWEKDFEGGNARALALVSYLDEVVSRDDNPDDIGQIREILADMLASSLLDDVQNAEAQYRMEQAAVEGMEDTGNFETMEPESVAAENTDVHDVETGSEETQASSEEEQNSEEGADEDEDTAEEELKEAAENNETEEIDDASEESKEETKNEDDEKTEQAEKKH